jgi:acylphosphatase
MPADHSDPTGNLDSGPFGRGGHRSVSLRMEFCGRLGPAFLAFVRARAERLDLKGWAMLDGTRVLVVVQGPEAMAGAFEVACCIGPDEDEVQSWTCIETEPNHAAERFELRGAW